MISNNSYVRTTQNSNEKITGVVNTIKKFINIKNIIFIILSFAMSNTSFMGDSSPFSLVLFGVASVFNVPLILVLISSIVGILGSISFYDNTYKITFVFCNIYSNNSNCKYRRSK